MKFYSKSKEGKPLSNFADLKVVIEGREYKTGEHAFHGEKYMFAANYTNDLERKGMLLEYAAKFRGDDTPFITPLDAKKAGGKSKHGLALEPSELTEWDMTGSVITQTLICKYKYMKYESVRSVLNTYSNYILVHQDNRANASYNMGCKNR